MLAGGRIGPFAGGTLAGFGSGQPDEHAPAGCAFDIADQPIATLSASFGQIMTANAFGIAGKPAREVGCLVHRILPEA